MRESTIICDHAELKRALQAAAKVAEPKNFPRVQFRPDLGTQELGIVALASHATFVARVPMVSCELVIDRDEIFEITLGGARKAAGWDIILPEDYEGDAPDAVLTISDGVVEFMDGSGVSRGVSRMEIFRSGLELPGDARRTILAAQEEAVRSVGAFHPSQLRLAAAVAVLMGERTRLEALEVQDSPVCRLLVRGTSWSMTVTEAMGEATKRAELDQPPLPMSFDDAAPEVTTPGQTRVVTTPRLAQAVAAARVVAARVPGGAA